MSLAKNIYLTALEPRSAFKKLFDSAPTTEELKLSVRVAHEYLAKLNEYPAIKKLLDFQRGYFEKPIYIYSSDEVKDATQHCIDLLVKYADVMTEKLEKKESINGYARFIHNSTAALARKIDKLNEDAVAKQSDFNTAIHHINDAIMPYHFLVKNMVDKAIGKVSASLGVVSASIDLGSTEPKTKQLSGVSTTNEIKHINAIIDKAMASYDAETDTLPSIQKAHLSRAIHACRVRLLEVENLETRFNYLSIVRIAINKHAKQYSENIQAYILSLTAMLKDEKTTAYKNAQYQAKVIARNSVENSKTFLSLTHSQSLILVEQAETQLITQSEESRYQSWAKLACAISMLTGRRIYEVCITATFEVVNAKTMRIVGVAKQKNDDDRENKTLEFHTFTNAHLIKRAVDVLRELKDFSVYGDDYMSFNKKCGTALRNAVTPNKPTAKPFFDVDFLTIKLTPKSMRQLYSAILRYRLEEDKPNQSSNYYDSELAKNLGHNAETDILTVQSYKDIVIKADAE